MSIYVIPDHVFLFFKEPAWIFNFEFSIFITIININRLQN